MIYETPDISAALSDRLEEVDDLRGRLEVQTSGRLGPWMGSLRRTSRATSVSSSTEIEGFSVAIDKAVGIVAGEAGPTDGDIDQIAVAGYAHAMDHVTTMSSDPAFGWTDRVVLDLHFDACHFQRDKRPGLWRAKPIGVAATGGGLLFEGPDADLVPALIEEMLESLRGREDGHLVVRAAMAHLNLVSIHPFEDGNGRVARIVQSLVLAHEGALAWEFASIEEYLRDHTAAYYDVLREVQDGSYQPERNALPWVAFCVDAHIAQARRRLDQIARAAARWERLESLVSARGWPDRFVVALERSLIGGVDRRGYAREAEVSTATATADLRRILDSGLIDRSGDGRNIRYTASDALVAASAEP